MINLRTVPIRQISQLQLITNPSQTHLNIARQKIRQGLRKSKEKQHNKIPLKQQSTNIPFISIDLADPPKKQRSIEPLERCRNQLSLQKQILLKQLQLKEEKVERLRQTYRKIQTSKSKNILLNSEDRNKTSSFSHAPSNLSRFLTPSNPNYKNHLNSSPFGKTETPTHTTPLFQLNLKNRI